MNTLYWLLGVAAFLFLAIVGGIVLLRTGSSHSKKMLTEQAKLNRRNGIQPPDAPKEKSGEEKSEGKIMKVLKWLLKHFWTAVLVLAGLAIFYFGMYTPSWDSPSLASTVAWARAHWLAVLAFSSIIFVLTTIYEKVLKEVGEGLQWVLGVALFMLFIGFPIWVWLVEPSKPVASAVSQMQRQCTARQPCALEESDGSTDRVPVPPGKTVCFEKSFWEDLPRLGYRISYQGGVERQYSCTPAQAASGGVCNSSGSFDVFRFVPETGTRLPKYWFAPIGTRQC